MTLFTRLRAWFRPAPPPPSLVHFSNGDRPLCYTRGTKPRKGTGATTDRLAVTCRKCRAILADAEKGPTP